MSIYIQEALERLKQLDEAILIEGKNLEKTFDKYQNSIKAQSPEDKRQVFNNLMELDPTYQNGSETTGNYGEWILNQYSKGNLPTHYQQAELATALSEFEKNKKYISNKDINSYKTVDELFNAIENAQPSKRQMARQQKNAKSNKDIKLLYQDDDWEVYTPLTYAGAVYLGKGTNWCTAAQSIEGLTNYACYTGDELAVSDQAILDLGYSQLDIDYVWEEFNEKDPDDFGPLYVIINKHDPTEKYQFHQESEQYMDKDDDDIDYDIFLYKNSGLRDFFINECGYPELEELDVLEQLSKESEFIEKDALEIKDITLLTEKEAFKLPKKIKAFYDQYYERGSNFWWVRPEREYSKFDAPVMDSIEGDIIPTNIRYAALVRPVLIVSNLDSFEVPLYSKVQIELTTWVKISDDMLLCDEHSFGSYIFDGDYNDYEKSEIKEYIHLKAEDLDII